MSPKRYYTFMIDPELGDALKVIKERDGVSESEQIRRALREWFQRKGLLQKAAPAARANAPKGRKPRQQR